VLRSKLAAASDSVTGQTNVDKAGYLTDLDSIKINTEAEIGDIKKARLLLKSVTESNPKHAPGWIAFARLEEAAGRVTAARKIINEGCEHCPTNQDVWLEAARINLPEQSKTILARAVSFIPESVPLWLEAANLEQDVTKKKKVLRKALEINSTSVKLWKEAIQLEGSSLPLIRNLPFPLVLFIFFSLSLTYCFHSLLL
jgi:pre-mRNA-processing factor 6